MPRPGSPSPTTVSSASTRPSRGRPGELREAGRAVAAWAALSRPPQRGSPGRFRSMARLSGWEPGWRELALGAGPARLGRDRLGCGAGARLGRVQQAARERLGAAPWAVPTWLCEARARRRRPSAATWRQFLTCKCSLTLFEPIALALSGPD